ncbi:MULTISPECIES: hypothetical protein [unclassified Ensifer]|uniref:hypothetical protein n=1 Tax=unclassified Ensifer TaxID=2633371 RepID=UPI00081398CD|nr:MULTISPECIES: hypothetical protein [unclassified Ensifer]OCP21873.1 hypothetical protein BC361_25225 [Ensifer sp. LC54]OCP23347.1 hypothetical protein BC363_25540 [Ensifer sp. LC384]
MAKYLTLSSENQAQTVCPIFNAKTKVASCMLLRERVWAGTKIEKRQGCQVAMRCGMCPATAIVDRIGKVNGQLASDDYGSLEPKVVRIHAPILERIKSVIPLKSVLDQYQLTPEERQMLQTTRGRIEEQLKTAPGRDGKSTAYIAPQKIDYALYGSTPVSKRKLDIDREEADFEVAVPRTVVRTQPKSAKDNTINRAAMTGDMSVAINAAA